jgi:NAD(P)-dependent dehydrogenase (short-subunit alcohol dehydrogenase family)
MAADLYHRTVLISGVSSGIGAATASRLLSRGDTVLGLSRKRPALSEVHWQAADVRDASAVEAAVRAVLQEQPRLDAVICNSGAGILGSVEEVPVKAARDLFDLNYFGVVNVLRATLPRLRAQRSGRVILMASLASQVPLPFQAHYAASKAAVESLGMALSIELAPFGVTVSVVEPGDIRTRFNQAMQRLGAADSPYRPWLANCAEAIARTMSVAPGPDIVVQVIERILSTPRPRIRYRVGPASALVGVATRLLPDAWNLGLIRRHYGLSGWVRARERLGE